MPNKSLVFIVTKQGQIGQVLNVLLNFFFAGKMVNVQAANAFTAHQKKHFTEGIHYLAARSDDNTFS